MTAGTLEIAMIANVARLQADMTQAKGIVGGAAASMSRSIGELKNLLGTLGVGISAGLFGSFIKGTIDALDHINDLTKSTNIAAGTLAGLGVAAKQSGGDLDSIAASINKLSINIGKDPEKFRALGISAKEPIEAFKQLADLFTKLEDPQQRAAVMAAALGKSWAGAAPLLAEGGKRVGEMIERGEKLSGVTSAMVKQADELNDKWILLTGTGGTMVKIVGPLLPLFNSLADDLLRMRDSTDSATKSFSPLLEIMKVLLIVGSDVVFVFTTIGKDMARMFENVQLIATGRWEESRKLGQLFSEDAKRARSELDAWQKKIVELGSSGAGGLAGATGGKTAAQIAAERDSAARAKAFLADGKEADSTYKNLLKSLQEKLLVDKQIMEVSKLQLSLDALSAKQRATITPEREKELMDLAAKVDLKNQEKKLTDLIIKSEEVIADQRKEDAEAFAAARKVRDEALASGYKQLEQMEFELKLIGLTNQEREVAIKMRELETSEMDKQSESYLKLRERMKGAIISRDQAEEAKRVSVGMWQSFEDAGHQAFLSLFDTSKSVLERIGAMIKTHLIEALYQLTIKPYIIQFVASMSGQGVAQAAFGSSGGGMGVGNILSGASNLFGGTGSALASGASSMFGASSFTAALAGDAFMPAALGSMGTGAAGAGAMAGAGAASAIPYVGWAIAAYALLSSMDKEKVQKPSQIMLQGDPGGSFNIGQIDTPGGAANLALYHQYAQENQMRGFNDPAQYDQQKLNELKGRWIQGAPGESAEAMVQKLLAYLEPARTAAAATAAAAAADAIDASIAATKELSKAEQELARIRTDAVRDATQGLRQAYDRESGELKRMADEWGNASKSLRDYASTLSGSVTGITYTTALRQFNAVAMSAQGGDISAAGDLQGAGETFRLASLGRSASTLDYARDVARIRRTVGSTADFADAQESVALQQLDALETQVSTLIDINGELVTVNEAMAILNSATAELRASLIDQARDTKSTKDLITAVANGSISLYTRTTQVPA